MVKDCIFFKFDIFFGMIRILVWFFKVCVCCVVLIFFFWEFLDVINIIIFGVLNLFLYCLKKICFFSILKVFVKFFLLGVNFVFFIVDLILFLLVYLLSLKCSIGCELKVIKVIWIFLELIWNLFIKLVKNFLNLLCWDGLFVVVFNIKVIFIELLYFKLKGSFFVRKYIIMLIF